MATFFNVKSDAAIPVAISMNRSTTVVSRPRTNKPAQQTMNNYMIDTFLVSKINKKHREDAKALKATAAASASVAASVATASASVAVSVATAKQNINEIILDH